MEILKSSTKNETCHLLLKNNNKCVLLKFLTFYFKSFIYIKAPYLYKRKLHLSMQTHKKN